MSNEPEVDPYFSDALKSRDPKRIERAIKDYLKLYIEPETISKIVFVDDDFFIDDNRDRYYQYTPDYEKLEKQYATAPYHGSIILNIDSASGRIVGANANEMFHSILLSCLCMQHLMNNPEDTRLMNSMHGERGIRRLVECFNYELYKRYRNSHDLEMYYIPQNLSGLYTTDNFYDLKISNRIKDDLIISVDRLGRRISFAIKSPYQKSAYDDLSEEKLEEMLKTRNIDDIIRMRSPGKNEWLTPNVFASTFDRADDGFFYAVIEGDDDLINAIVARDSQRVYKIITDSETVMRIEGNWVKEWLENHSSSYHQLYGSQIAEIIQTRLLRRKNSKIDALFLKKPVFGGRDLINLISGGRYDMLLKIPVEKLNMEIDSTGHHVLYSDMIDMFEIIGSNPDDIEKIPEAKEVIVKYWPIFKSIMPSEDRYQLNRILKDGPTPALYMIIKEIDPETIHQWLKGVDSEEWKWFRDDDLYDDLIKYRPITDDEIRNFVRREIGRHTHTGKRAMKLTSEEIISNAARWVNPRPADRIKQIGKEF